MGRKPPGRYREDVETDAGLGAPGVGPKIPFQRPLDPSALPPGHRLQGVGMGGSHLDLDSDQPAAPGRQNVDFPDFRAISFFKDVIAL